jgi:hypothetical protein
MTITFAGANVLIGLFIITITEIINHYKKKP